MLLPSVSDRKRKPQIIVRLAIIRIGTSPSQTFDSCSEIALCILKSSTAQEQYAVSHIDSAVSGISFKTFQIVRVWKICSMAVLLNMLPGQEQFLIGQNLLRILCRLGRLSISGIPSSSGRYSTRSFPSSCTDTQISCIFSICTGISAFSYLSVPYTVT